jgi:hypothetical protein
MDKLEQCAVMQFFALKGLQPQQFHTEPSHVDPEQASQNAGSGEMALMLC